MIRSSAGAAARPSALTSRSSLLTKDAISEKRMHQPPTAPAAAARQKTAAAGPRTML